MPLFDLVQINSAIGEGAAQRFTERFSRIEEDLLRRLERIIRQFPSEGGRFVLNETTAATLNEVGRVLNEIMKKEELREAVRDLSPEFDRIGENVATMHGEENGLRVGITLLNDTKRRMIQVTAETMLVSGYDARFAQPVKRVLYNHVNFGANVLDAERAIRALVRGTELAPLTSGGAPRKRPGLLSQYAGGVARDAVHQYEGQVHAEIAKRYELDNMRYVGTVLPGWTNSKGNKVGGTRPQCRRWVEKELILGTELEAELAWARRNGSGLIPGTTPGTFPIFRGGYNCRHKAIPTRRE